MDFPALSHLFQYLRYCTTTHFFLKLFYFVLAQFFCLAGHFPRYLDLCRCEFTAQSPTMVWLPQKSPRLQGLCLGLGVHMNEPLTPPSTNLRPACISCWALLEGTGNISAEAAALQRCRGCRRTCCDCLRTLWPFCRHLEGTVLCAEGLGNPTCKATALSTEMQRMKSPEQRVCTRAAHDTSPGTRRSLLGHRMHQSQLKYHADLATHCRKVQVLPVLKASLSDKFQKKKQTV